MLTKRTVSVLLLVCFALQLVAVADVTHNEPEYIVPTFYRFTNAFASYLEAEGFDSSSFIASRDALEFKDGQSYYYIYFGSQNDGAMNMLVYLTKIGIVSGVFLNMTSKYAETCIDEFNAAAKSMVLAMNEQYTKEYVESVLSTLHYNDVVNADIVMNTSFSDGYLVYAVSNDRQNNLQFKIDYDY